jgi:hypothetical protein
VNFASVLNAPRAIRLALLGLGVALAALAWHAVLNGPVADLRAAQRESARIAALLDAPELPRPLLLPRDHQYAGSRHQAPLQLRDMIAATAAAHRLLIEDLQRLDGYPEPLVAVRLRLSGPEAAVRRFVGEVERARPVVRFSDWRLEPVGAAGSLRFEAKAAALWIDTP